MREIPDTCLTERSTTCLIYTGEDIPELDIKNGDSIEYVVKQLASTSAPESVTDSITVQTFSIPILSNCASQIANTAFKYSIQNTQSAVLFYWDIVNALPPNFSYVGTTVRATNNGTISESTSRSAYISLPLTRLPATISVQQRVSSPCGDIILSKIIPVTATLQGEFNAVFDITDVNTIPTELTIEQAFDQIMGLAIKNQQQIQDFNAADDPFKVDSLDARVTDLENAPVDDSVTYLDNGIEKTGDIGDVITDMYSVIRANEANINVIFNEIDALKVLIANVS